MSRHITIPQWANFSPRYFFRNLRIGKRLLPECANYSPRSQVFVSGGEQFRLSAYRPHDANPNTPSVSENTPPVPMLHFFATELACLAKKERLSTAKWSPVLCFAKYGDPALCGDLPGVHR